LVTNEIRKKGQWITKGQTYTEWQRFLEKGDEKLIGRKHGLTHGGKGTRFYISLKKLERKTMALLHT